MNWDSMKFSTQERDVLGLHSYWSDINQNGLPEFAIYQYSGCQACNETNGGRLKLLEIQAPDKVVDLAAGIPGQLAFAPGTLIHTKEPLTINAVQYFLYDANAFYAEPWFFRWQNGKFVNVSSQYPDDYRRQAHDLAVQSMASRYWQESDALTILALYNDFHLPPKEGLDLFLEVTNRPPTWSNDSDVLCWRQLARAYAQLDYEHSVPFRNFSTGDLASATATLHDKKWADQTKSLRAEIDEKRFDVSACK
jgi:hypothetical protein